MNRFIWWHKVRGHRVETHMVFFAPRDYVHCIDCRRHWTKEWL